MNNQQPKQEPYSNIPNAGPIYGPGNVYPSGQQGYPPPIYTNEGWHGQQQAPYAGVPNGAPGYQYTPGYQSPMYGNGMYVQPDPDKGMAVASLVLGIVSIVLSLSLVGIICAILSMIFAKQGSRSITSGGMARTGRILSIIGLSISGVVIVVLVSLVFAAMLSSSHSY